MIDIKKIINENNTVIMSDILSLDLSEEEYEELITQLKQNNILILDSTLEDRQDEYVLQEEKYPRKIEDEDIERMYIREAKRYSVLTKEEERDLLAKIKSGDKQALNKFVKHNQRLIMYAVSQYNRAHKLEFLDAVQEGNLGMLKAIEKFDLSMDYKFSTYSLWWIKQYIQREISRSSRLISVPAHREDTIRDMRRYEAAFLMENQRFPNLDELSKELSMSKQNILALKALENDFVSMESTINDDEDILLKEVLVDEDDIAVEDQVQIKIDIEKMHEYMDEKFTPREKYIYEKRIVEGQTLEEVGVVLGITRERVRQVEKKIYLKLLKYATIITRDLERNIGKQKKI